MLISDGTDDGIQSAFAARIRQAIQSKGACLVFEKDLSIIWRSQSNQTVEERTSIIRKFASAQGFDVKVSSAAKMALFRNPGAPA